MNLDDRQIEEFRQQAAIAAMAALIGNSLGWPNSTEVAEKAWQCADSLTIARYGKTRDKGAEK